jgi:hypothetical protein
MLAFLRLVTNPRVFEHPEPIGVAASTYMARVRNGLDTAANETARRAAGRISRAAWRACQSRSGRSSGCTGTRSASFSGPVCGGSHTHWQELDGNNASAQTGNITTQECRDVFQDRLAAQPGCSHQDTRSRRNRSWRRPLLLLLNIRLVHRLGLRRCTYRYFPVFLPFLPQTAFAVSVGLDALAGSAARAAAALVRRTPG